jgi:hypothetical protein
MAARLKLLNTAGRLEAIKGPSGQLHRNRLFWLKNCMESSWTSSRNLWLVTWLEINTVHITWRLWKERIILLKGNRYIRCFCQLECCQYKILTESFTLGPTIKIDFTRTVEHTLATARELADLQFSLTTLSKHYGIIYWILTSYKPKATYLLAYRKPNTVQIWTLASNVWTVT